ncbi:hypothetical protein TgHK011_002190 [Trichoderma gracile]|nr:hypothetical protein TgHK011_002190 [Trichoderma gracile]
MAPFTLGMPSDYLLDNLKHDLTSLLYHAQSVSFEILALVIIVLWAGMQRRLLMHLTAMLSGMQWNDAATRYEDPTSWFPEHDDCPSEKSRKGRERLLYIVLYLSMYINCFSLAPVHLSKRSWFDRPLPLVLSFSLFGSTLSGLWHQSSFSCGGQDSPLRKPFYG